MRTAHARHALPTTSPQRVRRLTVLAGLCTALAVPLTALPADASVLTTASAGTAAASPLLRQGSRGAAVVDVQRRVRAAADGRFGPRTRAAVVRFQRARHLSTDGVVGPRTWAALRGAAPSRTASSSARTAAASSSRGAAVVREAARHAGQPYRYGAAGPRAFDCSGFVQYVYGRVGVSLPRTSSAQAAAVRRVPQSAKRPGDLIAMRSGGRVTHVGIYAGANTMWVARHTGTTIARQKLWTSSYSVGRVV